MPNRLAEHAGHDAVGSPLHELESKRTTDTVAHEEELSDAEVVHQSQLVVGKGSPRIINRDRAAGFTAVCLALVHRDASELVFQSLHGVEHRGGPIADTRVQAPAGADQQRTARASLF